MSQIIIFVVFGIFHELQLILSVSLSNSFLEVTLYFYLSMLLCFHFPYFSLWELLVIGPLVSHFTEFPILPEPFSLSRFQDTESYLPSLRSSDFILLKPRMQICFLSDSAPLDFTDSKTALLVHSRYFTVSTNSFLWRRIIFRIANVLSSTLWQIKLWARRDKT